MRYPFETPAGYEETLNQQIVGHLHYSLQEGATLLNSALADVPISFTDSAEVVAHQDDPLPHTPENEIDREIDWVIEDEGRLVGFESKYGASLGRTQLEDELIKLRANADDRDVHLIAITHHATEPSLFAAFETEPIYWTNWVSVVKRLNQLEIDDVPPGQRVPLRMLRDLFEEEDMDPFTGFDHRDKHQYRYFIRDLRPEVNELGLENRGKLHNWVQGAPSPSGGSRIVPKYLSIPFVQKDRPAHNEQGRPKSKRASLPLVIVDTETHEVYAGVTFDIQKVDRHRELLQEEGGAIAEACHEAGFEIWIGRNSINNTKVPPEKTQSLEEMTDWLSVSGKQVLAHPDEDNNYRKVWFVRHCPASEPEAMFEEIIEALEWQVTQFIERDEFLETASLVDPATVDKKRG